MNSLTPLSVLNSKTIGRAYSLPGYHLLKELVLNEDKVCIIADKPLEALLIYDYLKKYRKDCLLFSDHELMPYDNFSLSPYIAGERNSALYSLLTKKRYLFITSIPAITYKLPPCSFYLNSCIKLSLGDELSVDTVSNLLIKGGFQPTSEVHRVGEFSKRGFVLDFFPAACDHPLRIEFFEDSIESLRTFSVDSQMTLERIESVDIVPLSEYLPSDQNFLTAVKNFKLHTGLSRHRFLDSFKDKRYPTGFQFFLPMLYGKLSSLQDFLQENTKMISFGDLKSPHDHLCEKIDQRASLMKSLLGFAPYAIDEIAVTDKSIFSFSSLFIRENSKNNAVFIQLESDKKENIFESIAAQSKDNQRLKYLFATSSPQKSMTLKQQIKGYLPNLSLEFFETIEHFLASDCQFGLLLSSFHGAFFFPEAELNVFSQSWLYSYQPIPLSKKSFKKFTGFEEEAALQEGQLVVHQRHGIARYQGLKVIEVGSFKKEMNELLFADNDKLYVPLEDIDQLSPYFSLEPENVVLHKLGASKWSKQKEKAYSQAIDQATQLLEIYAKREKTEKKPLKLTADYDKFCSQFPYQETEDQASVSEQVLKDLCSSQPMDRLICGDVGFGKTEVALRAMFVAVLSGQQVAFLAPTTLLAQQHFETCLARFDAWPVTVRLMVRGGRGDRDYQDVQDGKVDILIGTHKILQSKVQYAQLGLIVIDEEHRFGVAQKEQLKKYRSQVDVLSMTATPIPRTLSMSFHGLRDLSIIATPPERRLKVETLIYEHSLSLFKEAAEREFLRGGQIYYVHNDIETMPALYEKLSKIFPHKQIGLVHGQQREKEQERVMSKFYHQDLDILIGTTIIETGLDVPNANTIFIDRADLLGLSQLHQLRGRVGRSYHQAYAYLFIPLPLEKLPKNSQWRLQAIFDNQDLGSGFQLASTDLEIRGAGSLLSDKQSGHIQDIGMPTYKKLLEKARRTLEGESLQEEPCKIDLFLSAYIPEKQIPCPFMRLKIYKMWQNATQISQLELYKTLFIDRFGKMLPETENKYQLSVLHIKAHQAKIKSLMVKKIRVSIELFEDFSSTDKLFALSKAFRSQIKFTGSYSLEIKTQLSQHQRIDFAQSFLDYLLFDKPEQILEAFFSQ